MAGLFGKEEKKKNKIVVMKKTSPKECGGTDAYRDADAPREIQSHDMILFEAESALPWCPEPEAGVEEGKTLSFVSAFAAPSGDGYFIYLERIFARLRYDGPEKSWAFVKESVFPELDAFVREFDLAKENGYHSRTHGLPENFGGEVSVKYASGEKISFSDNGGPILSLDEAERIAAIFDGAMAGERIALPSAEDLTAVRFEETRKDGGLTRAELSINADGTAVNRKKAKYDGPTVYESEKILGAESVGKIKARVTESGILAWAGLPENGFPESAPRTLTFVFADGCEIAVSGSKLLPGNLGRAFFDIELEMN